MNIIKKIIAPTKQHHEEFLTLWIADLEEGKQIWVQTSPDLQKPHWERYGDIIERKILRFEEGIMSTLENIDNCVDF